MGKDPKNDLFHSSKWTAMFAFGGCYGHCGFLDPVSLGEKKIEKGANIIEAINRG